jgi:hypothetical protein
MATDRQKQTLADYVAIAISPALIMALVGSLVFFLLEVLYPEAGEYKGRLQWILFFFVFGAVLVGRISMTSGIAGRAGLYGLVLAGLAWVGMQIYADYPKGSTAALFGPLINLVLVAVVWWCAHRLTWDCTYIDDETESNGEGLLQATGLEKAAADAGEPGASATGDAKKDKSADLLIGWWERFQRYRDERKKKRMLGAWVIYFSLAALPLFGLGEALIPVEEGDRRLYVFWLMCLYVGSGLGLLATTCFLGVRRYLRQRRLQMPAAMTGAWLTVGGGLILALLLIGALLPRPRPEYSLITFGSDKPDQRSASDYATQGGSSGKDQGRQIGDAPKDKAAPSDKDAKATGKDKGQPSQEKDKGDSPGNKDKDGSAKGQDKDKDSSEKDKGDASNRPKGNDAPDPNRDKSGEKSQQQPQQKDSQPRDKTATQQNQQKSDNSTQSQGTSHPGSSWDWSAIMAVAATILKWVVFGLLIMVVVLFLLREGLKFLANFTDWAKNLLNFLRNFWANLFRGRANRDLEGAEEVAAPSRSRLAPFSAFVNPFLDGRAERRPIKELVRYTFDALQAWARERNVERQQGETPLEFGRRLREAFPALQADVRRLTSLYARAVYDYSPLPGASLEVVRQFWQQLEAAARQPVSA